jgi:hypothetical protein
VAAAGCSGSGSSERVESSTTTVIAPTTTVANKTTEEIKAETRSVHLANLYSTFGVRLSKEAVQDRINDSSENLRKVGPRFTRDQYNQYMIDLYFAVLLLFDGDSVESSRYVLEQIGSADARQFQKGNAFSAPGFAEAFMNGGS